MKYNPQKIERRWQKYWDAKKLYSPNDAAGKKKNFMLLTEFPYPSGNLHIGHWYAFSVPDILARYLRMNGKNVLYPVGFDAFGLPAENAALKRGINPKKWTEKNIAHMTKQLKSMGATFDWSRAVSTIDSEYYRWTQWLFLKMYERGLAYRAKTAANWCPSCRTVLANEQVIDGSCERCGTAVMKKELEQWMLKTTAYAGRLIDDVEKLDWPETTKRAQRNWIGRSEGVEIEFRIQNSEFRIKVFTTRPDTLFGATYLVLGPEHKEIQNLKSKIQNWSDVEKYIQQAKTKAEEDRIAENREKTGMELKGIKAVNPATNEEIPVFVADYVLGSVGTGAIMAVPAHDQRDFDFAKKFGLPARNVIEPVFTQSTDPGKVVDGLPFDHRDAIIAIVKHWADDTYITLKWRKVAWGTFVTGGIEKGQTPEEAARMEIREETGFLHPKLIVDFGVVHGKFYHVPKKVNRFAHARVLCFKLEDGAKENISEEEMENHEVLWKTKQELRDFLTPDSHLWALEMLGGNSAYTGKGVLVHSGKFDGMDSEEAGGKIAEFVGGRKKVHYRLRDWLISRQRYWGVPIPVIRCASCALMDPAGQGYQPVSEKDLPVSLPPLKDFKPANDGRSPLARARRWVKTRCPMCGGFAERETDTMDTFVDSSWYFMRYADPKNKKRFADPEKMKRWLPVPLYIGGAEHNTMHLLYSRFFTKVLFDLKLVHFSEPFMERRNHGTILGPDGQKMSKSRGNVVDPDKEILTYGADTVRMYLAFMGPYDQGGPWSAGGITGVRRFLSRVWNFSQSHLAKKNSKSETNPNSPPKADPPTVEKFKIQNGMERLLHRTIKKVGEDIKNLRFNTALSSLMILMNEFEKNAEVVSRENIRTLLKLLAPFAPHMTEELWQQFFTNHKSQTTNHRQIQNSKSKKLKRTFTSIHEEEWPEYDPRMIREDTFQLVIQVNGKTRDVVESALGITEAGAISVALGRESVKKHTLGKKPAQVFFIPNRLINLVF